MSTDKTTETTLQEPALATPAPAKPRHWGRFHVWLDALNAHAKKAEQRPGPDTSSET